ncbi:MAP/microtubule affinity-regulating kinase 4-like [Pteronotus mesoamericanus]|uniref:MAP/microtubule affinity-regulating kinase 4-like n=1 Tax=Pteronotus mesoamericanus TaxID=1884717 RepID=UPI0023EE2788|nr:MAP/microtubule affinity-regulating kinase 4-like [Pteronotus parnellii mesoamericanus]
MTNVLEAIARLKERFIGNYVFLRTIGKGSFAKVRLARHRLTGREVAIKGISHRDISRYFDETRSLKRLNHPNIVKLFEVIATQEYVYIVMEHVSGGDLREHLHRHGRMSEGQARAIFRQVVSAMQYCHQQGVVHRDLKPDNILIDGEGNIRVADFGFARVFTNYELSTYCGTISYMAPEILRSEIYDGPKADVWSLGVVLYRMLVGEFPFEGGSYGKTVQAILRGNVSLPDFLSEESKSLLKMLFTLDPMRRPTLSDVMSDPWINMGQEQELRPYSEPPGGDIDPQVAAIMEGLGFKEEEIKNSLSKKYYDSVMGTYLILKTVKDTRKVLTIRVRPYSPPESDSGTETEEAVISSSRLGSLTSTPSSAEKQLPAPPPSPASGRSASLARRELRTATPSAEGTTADSSLQQPDGETTTSAEGTTADSSLQQPDGGTTPSAEGTTADSSLQQPDGGTPGLQQPDGGTPGLQQPDGETPGLQQPDRETPGLQQPDGGTPGLQQPDGGTPASPSGHSPGWQRVARRAFGFCLNMFCCCGPARKKLRLRRTQVKPT